MPERVTRRSFLKRTAITAGGVAAALAGIEIATPLICRERMEFDANTSPWIGDRPPKTPPLDKDIEVDVAVIGGGYTGLSAAYHMKRLLPRQTFVVLEARELGHGASGRHAGMCLPQTATEFMQIAHPKVHRLIYDVTVQCVKEIVALMHNEGMDSTIWFKGTLLANLSAEGVRKSREYAEKAVSMGIPVEYWDRERVIHEIGTTAYLGGLYEPNAAQFNPMMMVHALKRAAEKAGVIIHEDSTVLNIEEGEIVRLTVANPHGRLHTVRAKAIVLGTNAYTSKLAYFKNTITAVHCDMVSTRPLGPDIFATLGWNSKIQFHDDRTYLITFTATEDGRIMLGAGNAEYFFNNGLVYRKNLNLRRPAFQKELARVYPELEGIDFNNIWTGLLDIPLDFEPSVGVIGKQRNVYYGLGYAGHGVCLAYLFGKIIADMHVGNSEQWKEMPFFQKRYIPLPPEPLKYLSVKAYMALLRMQDKF